MRFKKGAKVTIWNGLTNSEDTIVEGVNGKLYLNDQDVEITEKTLEDFDVRFSEVEYNKFNESQKQKDKLFMDTINS